MRLSIALLILAPAMAAAQSPHPLDTLVNNTRALLVFAPSEADARFQQQYHLLQTHAPEMSERNLILIPVLEHWPPSSSQNDLRNQDVPFTDDAEQSYMRKKFKVSTGKFVAILIGKDGGEKLRSTTPLTIEKLKAIIDAMPMRQQEMRRKPPHS